MQLNNLSLKQKLIGAIIAIGLVLIAIFARGLYGANSRPTSQVKSAAIEESSQNPHVVSTNPPGLKDGVVISPDQKIEITFSEPIENRGEVKNTLDPKMDYEIQLSDDKKTVKLIPHKPFELGKSFTFIIKPDTKFDSKKWMDSEVIFHFTTISYQGV